MRLLRQMTLLAALAAIVGGVWDFGATRAVQAAPAAQTNLLSNGSFEGSLSGWATYYVPGAGGCGGQIPEFKVINKSVDANRVKSGDSAAQVTIDGGRTYQAGFQQSVNVTPGARYRFSVWVHVWSTTDGSNPRQSSSGITANEKIGVGNGETYAADPNVTWSQLYQYFDTYQQITLDFTPTGNRVTVFLMSNPSACNPWNDTYWDDASLVQIDTVATPAGATAAPTQAVNPCPKPTPFPTPTPGPDGKIVYTVTSCDTMWDIAAIAGLTVEQLKALNGLTSNFVHVGQKLVLGTGSASAPVEQPTATTAPAEATATTAPAEQPTDTPVAPAEQPSPTSGVVIGGTPVSAATTGEVCVMMYDDANGDGTRGAGEGLLAGGIFRLIDAGSGAEAGNYTTDGANEPHCFQNLAAGNYSIEASVPAGYNATTATTFALPLTPGGTANLEFGAQSGAAGGGATSASSSRLRTALFGAAGIIFLLLAAGVAGFLVLTQRGRRG